MRQKCGSGRLVPFETIDTSIYTANSNCTCFLTSEKRVHAWIQALAETLYIDLGSDPKYVVAWRDVRNDKSIMIQTEIIVSDNNSTSSDTNDDFLYKVVVYFTTGKIMIQGKSYEAFCDGYFDTCLNQVNNY